MERAELARVISDLRRLSADATPGPWAKTDLGSSCDTKLTGEGTYIVARGEGQWVAFTECDGVSVGSRPVTDARLIACMRTNINALVDVVDHHMRGWCDNDQLTPKYAGNASIAFFDLITKLPLGQPKNDLTALAITLQRLEERVLIMLKEALKK